MELGEMDPKQRVRFEELKKQNQMKAKEKDLLRNVLYQECVKAIKPSMIISDEDEIRKIVHAISQSDIEMHDHNEKADLLDKEQYLIVWDDANLPILKSSGKMIKDNWDDVTAVSFDTYLIAADSGSAIGIRH